MELLQRLLQALNFVNRATILIIQKLGIKVFVVRCLKHHILLELLLKLRFFYLFLHINLIIWAFTFLLVRVIFLILSLLFLSLFYFLLGCRNNLQLVLGLLTLYGFGQSFQLIVCVQLYMQSVS